MDLGFDVVVTITGIVLVFLILILLMAIITLEGKIFDSMNAKKKAAKEAAKAPVVQPAAPVQQAEASQQVSMSYGAVPFDLAAGTDQWWSIDSSDSAYWAVAENINAMRAAAGLPALTVDGGLSSIANSRCDSFASGGSFDHSGAVCGEIIAAGPFASASSVCAAWQSSPDHYASIVSPNYSSMGIGCWFCSTEAGQYTYWAVTFQ